MSRQRLFGTVLGVLCLAAAALAPAAAMASELRPVRSGTPHDMLFDLAFDGVKGISVGSFGSVLLSDDGGAGWHAASVPASALALLGTAISGGRCIAVGQGGRALVADDCRRWQAVATGSEERLMAVGLNRRGLAYAVGAFGTVLRSADGGRTWSALTPDWSTLSPSGVEPHLYGAHVDSDGTVTLVGEFGLVLQARDGAPWRVVHSGEQSLFGLVMAGDKAYAVGQGGVVLASEDRGASWHALSSGTNAILSGVWSDGHGRVVVAGLNTLLQSRDGGASWQRVDAGTHSLAVNTAVAAATDGGQTSRVLTVGAAARVLEIGATGRR